MQPAIRVMLADDHPMILESIEQSLKATGQFDVVGKFANGKELLAAMKYRKIPLADLLILDISMPELNGLDCMEVIGRQYPHLKVIVFTVYTEEFIIRRLRELGAKALIKKDADKTKLISVLKQVHKGEENYEDVAEIIGREPQTKEAAKLSKREKEIISLIIDGQSTAEIGSILNLSEYTVTTHRRNILKKLKLANTAQLGAFARASGIL